MSNVAQIAHNKRNLLEALEVSLGVVSTACTKVKLSRRLFYVYYNSDPKFKEDVDELQNVALDFAESKLFEKINGVTIGKLDENGEIQSYQVPPSDTALIFYLKTKGKGRGYIEKSEIDHSGSLGITWNEEKTY